MDTIKRFVAAIYVDANNQSQKTIMKNLIFTTLLSAILLSSCSKSDSDTNGDPSNFSAKDITVISIDDRQIHQIDILNSGSDIVNINLTQTLGFSPDYSNLITSAGFVTFFKFQTENYFVYHKSLISKTIKTGTFECALDLDEFLIAPTSSQKKIIEITGKPNGDFSYFFVRTYDLETGNCNLISLNAGQFFGFRDVNVMVDGEVLYVTYRNEQNIYEINQVDLNSGQIVNRLEFDSKFFATVDKNELHVFIYDTKKVQTYSVSDFQLTKTGVFSIIKSPGFFKAGISKNKIYTDISFAQPSPFQTVPVTIDLSTGEVLKELDLFQLKEKVSKELNTALALTTFAIDANDDLIVYGFSSLDSRINGIVYTNFSADILKIVQIDHPPIEIIIR